MNSRSVQTGAMNKRALLFVVAMMLAACGGSDGDPEPVRVGVSMKGATNIEEQLNALHAEMRRQRIEVLHSSCYIEEDLPAPGESPTMRANWFPDVLFVYEIPPRDLDAAERAGLSRSYRPERFQESPEVCSWAYPVIWTD